MLGIRALICTWMVILGLSSMAAFAAKSAPMPSEKPAMRVSSEVISDNDALSLRLALRYVAQNNWVKLKQLEGQVSDSDLKALLLWYRLRGNDTSVPINTALRANQVYRDWPSLGTIREHMEQRLLKDKTISPTDVIKWFDSYDRPETGDGVYVLARAYMQRGDAGKAHGLIKAAWANQDFSRTGVGVILQEFSEVLTQEDHEKRANYLLWAREFTAAKRMKPFVSSDWRKLIDARIALGRLRRGGIDKLVSAVPDHLKAHAGLKFERGRWRRRRIGAKAGIAILSEIDGADVIPSARGRLWRERRLSVRQAMKSEDWQSAYDLASTNGMHTGTDFSGSEWLAGWLALRYLGQTETAIAHFNKMRSGVSSPISLARADYWLGRANEATGNATAARAHYENAAKYFYTYYGQLAGEKISKTTIEFSDPSPITDAEKRAFMARPAVRIIRMLGEAGALGMARHFSYHLDDQLETTAEFTLLSQLAQDYQMPDAGVRAGKAGMYRHIVSPDAAYPLLDHKFNREPDVAKSLVFGLARQESEMNPHARSHAGAVGLMQFLPSTARIEARRRGMLYRTSWLMDDPSYALSLGGAHLDHLLDKFDGSYIMAIAAYNAGASRVESWLETYGDPRTGEIDPIDWVELIPFSETRNYVQRVLENKQVYAHRLSGRSERNRTLSDLKQYVP